MFPTRYFPVRQYAGRYFPPGGTPVYSYTADAILRALQSGTFDAAAVVRKPTSSSTTASAILHSVAIASLDANAILLTKQTAQIAVDAILREASTPFFVDAVFLSPEFGNFDLDAVLSTGANLYDLDSITEISQLDFTSSLAYLDHQPTWAALGTTSTVGATDFDGGLSFTQVASRIEAITSALFAPDIGFTNTTKVIDVQPSPRNTTVTSTTRMLDFLGGVEEVDDG